MSTGFLFPRLEDEGTTAAQNGVIGNPWIRVIVSACIWMGEGRGGSRKWTQEKPARHKLLAVIFMMTDETGYWNPGEALGLQPPFAIPGRGRFESGSPADLTPRRASAGPGCAGIRDK